MDISIDMIQRWHDAVNAGDVETALALLSTNVEIGGPRGSGRGADRVRDWVGRAGIRLEPAQYYHRGDATVVEQVARWNDTATGQPGEPQTVYTAFQVRDGRISRILRFDSLDDALQASGLSADDRDATDPAGG